MNDMCEAMEDFDEVEKLGQGFSSVDPLEEIIIGDGITPWLTMINDCFRYYKGCKPCQKFEDVQLAPAATFHPIIKP
jgi:hypothetical protein